MKKRFSALKAKGEKMTIKEIAKSHGISNRELARRCGIPIRTVENWSAGINSPPEYVLNLIKDKLDKDKNNTETK